MAITQMCDLKTAEAALAADPSNPDYHVIRDYHGHEEGRVSHYRSFSAEKPSCPHYESGGGQEYFGSGPLRPECDAAGCYRFGPLAMHTEFHGLVLDANGERNGRDDSDFYATVWDAKHGRTVEVTFATTRGWTYPNHAEADATPEVVAAYQAWVLECDKRRREAYALAEARKPAVGKTLKVVRGRKVPIGTVGECCWVGAAYRGPGLRVGIRLLCGDKVYTDAKNVEVVL